MVKLLSMGVYGRVLVLAAMAVMAMAPVCCRKPFEPEVFKTGDNYVVVDGFINIAPNGVTSFILSRTANVHDTAVNTPELHATMAIEDNSGGSWPLIDTAGKGVYTSALLNLNTIHQYRVSVKTAGGGFYRSDFAASKPTPPIDSITWRQDPDKGVTIYANTHDPSNNTIYYRWTYLETWQYESMINSEWGVTANDIIYHRDSASQQVHVCWNTAASFDVLLGSSFALGQDVISRQPIATLLTNDGRLDIRYSTLVSQYALPQEAYNYWQIIKENTQELGGLFAEQPSQLVGNVHSVNNPNEPVIGFVTVTNVQQSRLFISNHDLLGTWQSVPPDFGCQVVFTFQDPANFLHFNYPNKSYVPIYFLSGGGLAIAKAQCVDCTLQGGVTQKPSYW